MSIPQDEMPGPLPLVPPSEPFPAHVLELRRRHLEQCISATQPSRRSRRLVLIAGGATAASALVVGSAAAYVASAPATVTDQVRCYTVASLEGGDDFSGSSAGQAQELDGSRAEISAIDACSTLWRAGLLRLGEKHTVPPKTLTYDAPSPQLTACRLDNGMAAVLPGDDQTCARLGLPKLSAS